MTKRDEAKQDYLSGMKYKDIADKYNVSVSTIKSWKSRYWSDEKKVATLNKKVATKRKKVATIEDVQPHIDELDESGLNDKQKRFVIEYVRLSNATQAYINAYGCDYETAKSNSYKLLTNTHIQNEIKRLRKARLSELSIGVFDLVDDLAKEARADIGDYVKFGSYDLTVVDSKTNKTQYDDDGNPVVRHNSWIQLVDKDKVDTSSIKKITQGKDGVVVELHDKSKARDKLLEYLLDKGVFADGDSNNQMTINMDTFEEKNNGDG